MKRIRVAGVIPYENGFIFIHRIKPDRDYYAFVGGGKEENESNEEGCIREIKEETGINVEIIKQLYFFEKEDMLEYFYLCKYISGELGTGDGPEFNNDPDYVLDGQYIPETIKREDIEKLNLMPPEIAEEFRRDLKRRNSMKIVLASGSPRRKELLGELLNKYNLTYEAVNSQMDEEPVKNTYKEPDKLVEKLSHVKAKDIFDKLKYQNRELVVIGGDTIVYFENEFLGKPENEEHAKEMLRKIQGTVNYVYTGMTAIIKRNNVIITERTFSKIDVYMKPMDEKTISEYIATKDPLDKAGAYAIQGIGNKYIEKYDGNFNTAVGLDVDKLEGILKKYDVI